VGGLGEVRLAGVPVAEAALVERHKAAQRQSATALYTVQQAGLSAVPRSEAL